MLERAGDVEADRVRAMLRRRTLEPAEIEHIRRLVLKHAGVDYALQRAHDYAREAKRDLEAFVPSEERELLTLVADFVVDRDR
jgi:geranylgeranyl pyrophosphate synthase